MRTDFTDDEVKDQVRRAHIAEAITHFHFRFDRRRHTFRCDWLELASEQAPTAGLLLHQNLIQPGQKFIGWDLSSKAVESCERLYAAEVAEGRAVFCEGDLAKNLSNPLHDNVGVLVWDQTQTAHATFIRETCPLLFKFARDQLARLGEFMLVIAVSFRYSQADADAKHLDLLGEYLCKELDLPAFTRDDFSAYKGANSAWEMRYVRVCFV